LEDIGSDGKKVLGIKLDLKEKQNVWVWATFS